MEGRDLLGALEHLILVAAIRQGDQAFGAEIAREIAQRTGKKVDPAAIYVGLGRLEKKGLVLSHWGEFTPVSGGRAKRLYEVTKEGRNAAIEAKRIVDEIWKGVEGASPTQRGTAPRLNLKVSERKPRPTERTSGDRRVK